MTEPAARVEREEGAGPFVILCDHADAEGVGRWAGILADALAGGEA